MKKIYILGILAFLVFAVGCASATTLNVGNWKDGSPVSPNTVITADYTGNTITVTATPTPGHSLPTNFDIKEIYIVTKPYNAATSVSQIGNANWVTPPANYPSGTTGPNAYFYDPSLHLNEFTTICSENKHNIKYVAPIKITFTSAVIPQFNSKNFAIVCHVSWGTDSSNWVGNDGGSIKVPEFPTIALPVAGILGLMLILGRRNKE